MEVLLDDICNYLEEKSIGVKGTDLFITFMPDHVDDCISLFERSGFPPDLHCNVEYPVLEVRVRAKKHEDAAVKIRRIIHYLHGLYEQVLSGTRYLLIRAHGSPEAMERNEGKRVELVVRFEVFKEIDILDEESD